MRKISFTLLFEKAVKRAKKRGYDMSKLADIVRLLESGPLVEKRYKDHLLKGNYAGFRECHIAPDWLLIYLLTEDEVTLTDTGTHSDLFR